ESQTIEGFSNASIRVLDITNPSAPEELTGKIEEKKSGSFAVTVQAPAGNPRTLLALTTHQLGHAYSIHADQPSKLRSRDHSADFVMITNHQFAKTLEPLKTLRQKQGLAVEIVDVEDIYDEFNFGQKSPVAIKDFLSFAYRSWK